ncbi:hypothetical protein B0H12DRAFT_1127028, partial [Mycena haematopus]
MLSWLKVSFEALPSIILNLICIQRIPSARDSIELWEDYAYMSSLEKSIISDHSDTPFS